LSIGAGDIGADQGDSGYLIHDDLTAIPQGSAPTGGSGTDDGAVTRPMFR
jgi:hypothetical protein